MPSHTAASALVKLYSLNGAPWSWPKWQEITRIHHGLFPDDDQHLPKGWTRKNARDVESYFHAYRLLSSEDKRIAFAVNTKGSSSHPGREVWTAFVSNNWRLWGIHNLVVEELREWDVHPLSILVRENDVNAPWPTADVYLPMVLDTLALKLFGEEAFPDGASVLTTDLRKCLQIFVQRSWNTLRSQISGMKSRRNEIEASALSAFKGMRLFLPP
jgi:hypothetical protein